MSSVLFPNSLLSVINDMWGVFMSVSGEANTMPEFLTEQFELVAIPCLRKERPLRIDMRTISYNFIKMEKLQFNSNCYIYLYSHPSIEAQAIH